MSDFKRVLLLIFATVIIGIIMGAGYIINDKYSTKPVTYEYKVKHVDIKTSRSMGGKHKTGRSSETLRVIVENEFESFNLPHNKVRNSNFNWNLSEISDSIKFDQYYSKIRNAYHPKSYYDKKIVLDNTTSLQITYRIGFFKSRIIDEVICYYE
jgi:hypothetical protein